MIEQRFPLSWKLQIAINVWPSPESPGKNVHFLADLLDKLGFRGMGSMAPKVVIRDWGTEARLLVCEALVGSPEIWLWILDYMEEGWGGRSDNMITVSFYGKSPQEGTAWLCNYLKENGYGSTIEEVDSGEGYDVFVPDLFVDFKFYVSLI